MGVGPGQSTGANAAPSLTPQQVAFFAAAGAQLAKFGSGSSGGSFWKKNWDCVANVGWPVLKNDLNPFSIGVGTAADAASQWSQASLQAAAAWSVQRGLTVPLRSSVVRAGVANAEALGRASFLLTLIGGDVALGDAISAEHTGCTF